MSLTLAIDLGSTYTKVVAFDLVKEDLVGVAQSPSTVDKDVTLGLRTALEKLRVSLGREKLETEHIVACSSAAGGLRVVAVGLVRQLTTKVAEEAALGAGAKIVGTFSHGLSNEDIRSIEQINPDIILLTGGTDGGDEKIILYNAEVIARSNLGSAVVIAGNKKVAEGARSIIEAAGKYVTVVPNVLPELDQTNVQPAREALRKIFMRRIIQAKGLDKARALVGDIIMPTPMAVLKGAQLVAEGAENEPGLGDLMVVNVGGATTDVHSIGHGYPSRQGVIVKGLPEPYVKRTVEGDLGIRYNARVILQLAGKKQISSRLAAMQGKVPVQMNLDLDQAVDYLSCHIGSVPDCEEQACLDAALASAAVDIATRRHAGLIQEVYFPTGKAWVQYGKDLTRIKSLIGTGGIFAYGSLPWQVLKAACFDPSYPESLRPLNPELFIDQKYILYAVGLLAEQAPVEALRIMKKYLKRVTDV